MNKILIINGHQYYKGIAEGNLTNTIITRVIETLEKKGFEIQQTAIDQHYDVKEELEKLDWADFIFFQYPVYWMGVPWVTKKYIDGVFSAGSGSVTYINDGRSRKDPNKRYGSGGLMTEKKYMLSLTYNCPRSEFDNKEGFFDGLSVDEANIAVHKLFQFCGAKPLETYSIHDIFKSGMDLERELSRLDTLLQKNFG
ncbi:NAD(P)H-dependent oxidoreductase [Sulfurospirillum sp. 1612]|uniref:NAD(P)H-dependent oxidoreductase n=1 Tax=Sulfurospirillum sp. 1612 TaxID=3094835 RepID=UPI002F93981D